MIEIIEKILKIGNNFSLWFFYILLSLMVVGGLSETINSPQKNLNAYLIYLSIWLWCTVRWLKRKGMLSKVGNISAKKELKFVPFVLTNIIAPIIVAYVTFELTGQISISIISVPITSFLSANIELG